MKLKNKVSIITGSASGFGKGRAEATGVTSAGRCRFTANVVAYGPRGHPVAQIINDTFGCWFRILKEPFRLLVLTL